MAKLTLTDLASLTNETSAITTINNNNDAIEQAMEKTLTRDGTSPNSLSAQLDMNTHKIINLDKGTATGEALEYSQLQEKVDDIELIYNQAVTAKNQAQAAQQAAELAESGAEAAEDQAEVILAQIQSLYDSYNNQYLGAFASPPTVDNKGNPLTVGDLYYDSILLAFRVWDGTQWRDVASMTPTSNDVVSNKIYVNAVFRGNIVPETDDGVALGSTTKEFSDLFLASGAVINFNSSDVTITHNAASGGRLNFAGGSGGYYFSSAIAPSANDGAALGSGSVSWSDLFLASGAVINFNNSNVLLTHTANSLALTGVGTNGFSIDGALKILGGYGTTNGSGNLAIGSTNTGTNNISIAWGDNSGKTLNLGYAAAGVFTPRYKFVDTGAFSPAVNDSAVLGTSALMWSDLFLASGAVINFNNGNYTLTHSSGVLTASGTLAATQLQADSNFYSTVISNNPIISFDSTDSLTYGRSANSWYFNIGGTTPIYVNGTTIGPGVNDLTSLGTSGTAFSDLFLASGAVINFNNGGVVLTHSGSDLTVTTGNLRATTQSQSDNSTKVATTAYVDTATAPKASNTIDLVFVIGDGSNTISSGVKGYLPVDFNGTITQWTLVADQSGSIAIDLWKDTYANYPPTAADKVSSTTGPTISASTKGKSSTLTGWTTAFNNGDVFGINVASASAVTQVTLVLKVTKS